MPKITLLVLGSLALLVTALGQKNDISPKQLQDIITCVAVDPLEKVFKETAFFNSVDPVADVAQGEHASFQFVVRSTQTISHLEGHIVQLSRNTDLFSHHSWIGFVGYTRIGRPMPNPAKDKLNPISGFYPDPILDSSFIDLDHFTTQPVWISVTIPENFPAGDYTGLLEMSGKMGARAFTLDRRIRVKVYPVAIGRTRLWVTNWFSMDKNQIKKLSAGRDSVVFSDAYWYWLKVAARKMKEYDQNVIMTPPLSLAQISDSEGVYHFDWYRFDRFVQTFIDEGTLLRIEGGHLGGRMGNWYSQFGLMVPYWVGDSLRFRTMPLTDSAVRGFYAQFMPSLMAHLKAKGWDRMYLQHICDEPEPGNEASYAELAVFIKSLAPGIKIIEAVHSHGLNNTVDVWVPQLDFFHIDYSFYKERMAAGDEVWFYTCLAPQGDYANRFIELPLIKTRILHWINFRFGATGYLHWGWNFWSDDPFSETSGIIPEAGNIMPGGDPFITYPQKGKILSSIRLEAMRDGIVDYELLRMLGAKNPEAAREICRQVVYEFDRYDVDIRAFRAKRRRILELLSQ
jgi:Domain of unknown function (DUF4091)